MRNFCAAALLGLAALGSPLCAGAQTAAPAVPATPPPIRAGELTAYKYGSGPKTLILLPGLASGAFVWDSTVAALQSKYTMYAVTFDGFDGMPPAKPPYLDAFAASVEELIRTQNLRKPVLVGHSLGGDIALKVGIADSAALSGIVVVDSLPMFPPLQPGETLAQRQASAPKYLSALAAQSDADFRAASLKTMQLMITDPSQAAAVSAQAIKSDRATVIGAAGELATNDLGPSLPKITVPVLVLAAAAAYGPAPTQQFYAAQYASAPAIKVVAVENARHFIMYDQPRVFQSLLTGFVDGLK